jgi:hypothetical protein
MIVLFCVILVPLVNISFIPVRYLLCQATLTELIHHLAVCEKRSDAYAILQKDHSWETSLAKYGVTVSREQLILTATTNDGNQRFVVRQNQQLPSEWLPGGSKSPCTYSLSLSADCSIAPFFHGDTGIPGLNAPISMTLSGLSQWENLAKDPKVQKFPFFINE